MKLFKLNVLHNGVTVENNLVNEKVWVEGTVLKIADESFHVELNVPNITSMKLPKTLVSGFPCYPKLDTEFIDLNCCEFTWYGEKIVEEDAANKSKKKGRKKIEEWEMIHSGHTYTPSNSDIGRRYYEILCKLCAILLVFVTP